MYVFFVTGTFLWTKRGGKHPLLLLSGYTYSYQKRNADGRIFWYCSRRLKGCRASAISCGTRAIAYKPHDHLPPKLPVNCYAPPQTDFKYTPSQTDFKYTPPQADFKTGFQ